MNWVPLTLGCAFFTATTAVLSKKLLTKHDVLFVGWIRFLFFVPIAGVLYLVYRPPMKFTPDFWKTLFILFPLEFGAFMLYLKALKITPLSLAFPFLGFTPIFTIFFARLMLGEVATLFGTMGVVLITIGAYLLGANNIRKGALEPLTALFREKGVLFMLAVAFIYGITSVLGKKAALVSGPLSFVIVYYCLFFVGFSVLLVLKSKESPIRYYRKEALAYLLLGISFALSMLLHFNAIVMTNVPYVVSVKRLSLVISVIYGWLVFKERNILFRLIGSLVILGGALVLSFAE